MNHEQLQAELDAQVVTRINGRDVTRAELAQAFDRVADKKDWKNPIHATVTLRTEAEAELLSAAITFFTGSVATFTALGGDSYRVTAAGYFLTCGA